VINATLAGILATAQAYPNYFPAIYGARHGVQGILAGKLELLPALSTEELTALSRTPSAALGSCRRKLIPEDYTRILDVIRSYGVRYFLYIGGNDSADTVNQVSWLAHQAGYDLAAIGVPKTIDNDLAEMDHTPGYGSIARYLAIAVREAGLDAEATATVDPVHLIEVMGRDAGWVAAASALAREQAGDAPHLIYTPENLLSADRFLNDVEQVYCQLGHVVVVVSETVRDESDQPWAKATENDGFGHPRLVGAAERLCNLVRQRLGLRARFNKPGTLQRSAGFCQSEVDREEAFAVGREAVEALVAGERGVEIALLRANEEPYRAILGRAPLEKVAHVVRRMPLEFLSPAGNDVTAAFLEYARPLIGGPLPAYFRLRGLSGRSESDNR